MTNSERQPAAHPSAPESAPDSARESAPDSARESAPGATTASAEGGRPSRAELLAAHAAARRRRNAAPLGSEAWAAAVHEIARIEVAIAELDRTAKPPRL